MSFERDIQITWQRFNPLTLKEDSAMDYTVQFILLGIFSAVFIYCMVLEYKYGRKQ